MAHGAAPLTLGTAGHIDHGKTALIAALTGKSTDRLPEEKRRGISIELGYAPLVLPDGRQLSVVDVPGHERFVRTMVAGATGVDMFLLCVAADDGVMPQTREHMAVLRQLGVGSGVVAVTKSDTGSPDLAAEEAAALVPGAPVVQVSALRGLGLEALVGALADVAARVPGRALAADREGARLHVDRSFTLHGIGTVVTGTLWSGSVGVGDLVRVLPRGLEARVRSVQIHDLGVERAMAGQRVALNLVGVGWRDVGRGDVVVVGPGVRPGYLVDVAVAMEEGARALARGTRVQVHHGTREAPARVVPLGGGFAQLRLEAPLMAVAGDRLILRQVAPPDTIGGGVVVDAAPRKHGPSDDVVARLEWMARGEEVGAESRPGLAGAEPRPGAAGAGARGRGGPVADGGAGGAEAGGAEAEPEPLDDAALALASLLRSDGETPRADGDLVQAAGIAPAEAARAFSRLERAGHAVRVGRSLHFHPESLAVLEAQVVAICERDGEATIAGLRDELGTSRKYAQALLEHLDRTKVTLRRGDAHVLRRRRSP
jgi:selenocysteine-specific elongation factor